MEEQERIDDPSSRREYSIDPHLQRRKKLSDMRRKPSLAHKNSKSSQVSTDDDTRGENKAQLLTVTKNVS